LWNREVDRHFGRNDEDLEGKDAVYLSQSLALRRGRKWNLRLGMMFDFLLFLIRIISIAQYILPCSYGI
jgi:hypothetical protein